MEKRIAVSRFTTRGGMKYSGRLEYTRWREVLGQRHFPRRVGPARFERRPTISKRRELLVGRRGEAPLVRPDSLTATVLSGPLIPALRGEG